MTPEDQATEKLCPFKFSMPMVSDPDLFSEERNCEGSSCMAWAEGDTPGYGFCGLIGDHHQAIDDDF